MNIMTEANALTIEIRNKGFRMERKIQSISDAELLMCDLTRKLEWIAADMDLSLFDYPASIYDDAPYWLRINVSNGQQKSSYSFILSCLCDCTSIRVCLEDMIKEHLQLPDLDLLKECAVTFDQPIPFKIRIRRNMRQVINFLRFDRK